MKKFVLMLLASSLLMLVTASEAQAVVCGRGVYHAGCVGPNGAVVARRPPPRHVYVAPRHMYVAPVHRHRPPGCTWINGHKVCR
jgi:hypothetical protein